MHRVRPVHRSRLLNAWLFARHADGDAILRDHRNFGNDPRKGVNRRVDWTLIGAVAF